MITGLDTIPCFEKGQEFEELDTIIYSYDYKNILGAISGLDAIVYYSGFLLGKSNYCLNFTVQSDNNKYPVFKHAVIKEKWNFKFEPDDGTVNKLNCIVKTLFKPKDSKGIYHIKYRDSAIIPNSPYKNYYLDGYTIINGGFIISSGVECGQYLSPTEEMIKDIIE
jgi:hypothetical protein